MPQSNREQVDALLKFAAGAHGELLERLPAEVAESLPVDAQGITRAIDHLAVVVGMSEHERMELLRPHTVNPAVLHARVYGATGLSRETVIAAFVDGARVRADALGLLADAAGGVPLGTEVRRMLVEHPPPLESGGAEAVQALRETYAAQERAALIIAAALD